MGPVPPPGSGARASSSSRPGRPEPLDQRLPVEAARQEEPALGDAAGPKAVRQFVRVQALECAARRAQMLPPTGSGRRARLDPSAPRRWTRRRSTHQEPPPITPSNFTTFPPPSHSARQAPAAASDDMRTSTTRTGRSHHDRAEYKIQDSNRLASPIHEADTPLPEVLRRHILRTHRATISTSTWATVSGDVHPSMSSLQSVCCQYSDKLGFEFE